jgi:DNA-binding MarR family transcriptional regulator
MAPPVPTPPRPQPAAPPRPLDCADSVLDIMPAVMDAMRSAMRQHVGDQLSVPQFRCLNFIAHEPGSSVGAVANFLGVTMPTASAMVDRLVRAGAVALNTAAADRRRAELHATEAGLAQLRQVRRGARSEFARLLGSCSSDELQTLHAGLVVLQRAFQPA